MAGPAQRGTLLRPVLPGVPAAYYLIAQEVPVHDQPEGTAAAQRLPTVVLRDIVVGESPSLTVRLIESRWLPVHWHLASDRQGGDEPRYTRSPYM